MKFLKFLIVFSTFKLISSIAQFCESKINQKEDKTGFVFDTWRVKRVAVSFSEEEHEEKLMSVAQVIKCDFFFVKNLDKFGIYMSSSSCDQVFIPWTLSDVPFNMTLAPPMRMTKDTFVLKFELGRYFIIVTCSQINFIRYLGAYVFIDAKGKVENFYSEIQEVSFR